MRGWRAAGVARRVTDADYRRLYGRRKPRASDCRPTPHASAGVSVGEPPHSRAGSPAAAARGVTTAARRSIFRTSTRPPPGAERARRPDPADPGPDAHPGPVARGPAPEGGRARAAPAVADRTAAAGLVGSPHPAVRAVAEPAVRPHHLLAAHHRRCSSAFMLLWSQFAPHGGTRPAARGPPRQFLGGRRPVPVRRRLDRPVLHVPAELPAVPAHHPVLLAGVLGRARPRAGHPGPRVAGQLVAAVLGRGGGVAPVRQPAVRPVRPGDRAGVHAPRTSAARPRLFPFEQPRPASASSGRSCCGR